MRNGANTQNAREDMRVAALELRHNGNSLLDDTESIEEVMREIEKAHDLIVTCRDIGERLDAVRIASLVVITYQSRYLHDLPKRREDQVSWHGRRESLGTINKAVHTSQILIKAHRCSISNILNDMENKTHGEYSPITPPGPCG